MSGTRTDVRQIRPGVTEWPRELDNIESPPKSLWLRGRFDLLGRVPRIGIVGTRAPTPYGEDQAGRFARAFAAAGLTVVSGMARGIDQAAHQGALEAEGATIAVLGSGVLRPWPAGPVPTSLLREGLLVSEYEPDRSPRPHHFPMRNRILSGLCVGVVVIEAAHRSGSLITAHWAADQGRSVWALPGRIDHPMSRGTHRLIREGATLVESPQEIVEEIWGGERMAFAESDVAAAEGEPSTESELLQSLVGETLNADELAVRLATPVAEVLAELVELELSGLVLRAPGGLYRRANS